MKRLVVFGSTSEDRISFRMAYEAFRGRDPEKITSEARRDLAELQTALEEVSTPLGDLGDQDIDLRMRVLKPKGGRMTLTQRAYEQLVAAVEAAKFQAGLSRQVEALRDQLSAAERLDDEGTAKMRAVKR